MKFVRRARLEKRAARCRSIAFRVETGGRTVAVRPHSFEYVNILLQLRRRDDPLVADRSQNRVAV
jgi:hypothetical protein